MCSLLNVPTQPYCYNRHGYPGHHLQSMSKWKPKGEFALIAHTSLRASSSEDWYFDSGCSKHMTRIRRIQLVIAGYGWTLLDFSVIIRSLENKQTKQDIPP
ncbi:gag-pol polyprotein [Trifolium medium]|uniref:Gag-pol polyprotein n=1 Tax=Trifolium medium TaxID=97028 RepID=A0A392LYA4_9FABA|nr:gag-pol polyprotein [Trifolium medium]